MTSAAWPCGLFTRGAPVELPTWPSKVGVDIDYQTVGTTSMRRATHCQLARQPGSLVQHRGSPYHWGCDPDSPNTHLRQSRQTPYVSSPRSAKTHVSLHSRWVADNGAVFLDPSRTTNTQTLKWSTPDNIPAMWMYVRLAASWRRSQPLSLVKTLSDSSGRWIGRPR